MVPHTVNESIPTHDTTGETEVARTGISVSIHPITAVQWQALGDIPGMERSDLLREAIIHLLDLRDKGQHVVYPAAPKLRPEEKVDIKPRAVWLSSELSERFRERCANDRVAQSEFVLEALRQYLKHRDIAIASPL
jgi:metal-responsive CopG/Arc/MetJ family transcriptional regulator